MVKNIFSIYNLGSYIEYIYIYIKVLEVIFYLIS